MQVAAYSLVRWSCRSKSGGRYWVCQPHLANRCTKDCASIQFLSLQRWATAEGSRSKSMQTTASVIGL